MPQTLHQFNCTLQYENKYEKCLTNNASSIIFTRFVWVHHTKESNNAETKLMTNIL